MSPLSYRPVSCDRTKPVLAGDVVSKRKEGGRVISYL
jgi:hypothetical protein